MATICASSVSPPTRSARIRSVPVPLMVAPMTRLPGCFVDRHRLAGHHRLVDGALPRRTDPSTGIFSPGRTRSTSPTATVASGTSRSWPVANHARRLRRQPEQLPDRAARSVLRARSSSTWPSSTSDDDHD